MILDEVWSWSLLMVALIVQEVRMGKYGEGDRRHPSHSLSRVNNRVLLVTFFDKVFIPCRDFNDEVFLPIRDTLAPQP